MDKDKCGRQGHDEKEDSCGLKDVFKNFAQFGDKGSSGETISKTNVECWLEKANLMGDKGSITSADVSSSFQKVAKGKDRINMTEFRQVIEDLAKSKKQDVNELITKLTAASSSSLSGVKDILQAGKDTAKNLMGYGQDSSKDIQSAGKGAASNLPGCGKDQDASSGMDAMKKDLDPMNKKK